MSNVDLGDIGTQQNFLRLSVDAELVTLMKQRITKDSTVEQCITVLKEMFLENLPLFIRCWNCFNTKQPVGESFSMWYAKLKTASLDVDIYAMSPEEMVTVQLIVMTSDLEWQQELLKLKSPTEKEVVAAARAYEAVKTSRDNLGADSAL